MDSAAASRAPARAAEGRLFFRRRRVFWLLPVLLLFLPPFLNQYQQYVVNTVLVYVLVGIGFNVVVGNLGLLAFSNVAYFGLGTYGSALLMAKLGWPWAATVIPAGIIGALAGVITSIPAVRGVRLFYLAILTLAFGELMRWTYVHWESLTNGSMGMTVPSAAFPLDTDRHRFYVFLVLAILAIVATDRLLRSRFGRAFEAIRGNEVAAAAMGIPTNRYILLGFAWSGFIVGIGGAMFAISVGQVSPPSFNMQELILEFAVVMVGGLGSLIGSVIGAAVLTALPQIFISFPGFQELVFGVMIILVLLFLPRGLVSLLARLSPLFADRFYRE